VKALILDDGLARTHECTQQRELRFRQVQGVPVQPLATGGEAVAQRNNDHVRSLRARDSGGDAALI